MKHELIFYTSEIQKNSTFIPLFRKWETIDGGILHFCVQLFVVWGNITIISSMNNCLNVDYVIIGLHWEGKTFSLQSQTSLGMTFTIVVVLSLQSKTSWMHQVLGINVPKQYVGKSHTEKFTK